MMKWGNWENMKYLILLFPFMLSAQSTPPRTSRWDSIMTPTRVIQPDGDLMFIKVKVNGKDAIFLLDTGSGTSVFDSRQLKEYGLQSIRMFDAMMSGIGGNSAVSKVTNAPVIKIDTTTYAINLLATDLTAVRNNIARNAKLTIAGVLGSDFFEYHKTIIDYRRNRITFQDKILIPYRYNRGQRGNYR